MICVPAVPVACANEYGPRCVSQCTSPPWVVKSIDGSSDWGKVPSTNVTVPPVFGLVAGVELEPDGVVDDFFELPHALSATIEARARTATNTNLVYLLINPPPPRLYVPHEIYSQERRGGTSVCRS